MPLYEFVCNACKKKFTKTLTVAEHDAKDGRLPGLRQSRRRAKLVHFLSCHLEKECLNSVSLGDACRHPDSFSHPVPICRTHLARNLITND